MAHRSSVQIRAGLGHPVIDADGHFLELDPVLHEYFLEYAKKVGGTQVIGRFTKGGSDLGYYGMLSRYYATPEARRLDVRMQRGAFWFLTADTLDRATGYLPKLLHERLPELGIDFAVLYPSQFLGMGMLPDAELRAVASRAMNMLVAEQYAPYADRLAPVATIPMLTPQEAIAELDYCVNTLHFKAAMLNGAVYRQVPLATREFPTYADLAGWQDVLALDSLYDYDPLWTACERLGIAVASHAAGGRAARSTSSYVFNHIGQFAQGGDVFARALFLGGVTRRFPNLRFAFLEGGVGWACTLYAGLVSHWEKRGQQGIANLNPANLDLDRLLKLADQYGDAHIRAKLPALHNFFAHQEAQPPLLDEFAAAGIQRKEDIRDRFVPNFYFGCEADDASIAWAFDTRVNPLGAQLQPLFSSDISHWDVPSMKEVLEEAHELVDHGILTAPQFRAFTFENAARLYTATNPNFFVGTAVEKAVSELLS